MSEQDPEREPLPAEVTDAEAVAQAELRKVTEELESVRLRLEWVRASLPVPEDEALLYADEADMDVSTEIRSVVECVLNDSLLPAIRDLRAAAAYRPTGGGRERERR